MAIRDDFFNLLETGAVWDVAVAINRTNPVPIDKKSAFKSLSDLQTYASTDPTAYPTQVCAVLLEDNTVQLYALDGNKVPQEIGSGSGSAMIFVNNIADLNTEGTPPNGVPNDLEIGQQAFVSEDQKIHFLTALTGGEGDLPYVWKVQASDAPTWNDTSALVNFYVTDRSGYNGIGSKDNNTLYFLSDEQVVYKGTTDYTSSIIVVSSGAFPEVASAIPNKLYIDSDSFEVKITTDKLDWDNVSPGYITDGSNWAQSTDDSKLATIGAIKTGISADFIAKLDMGDADVLITATADGGIQRTSTKIGGATLAGSPNETTVATEAAVASAITDAISWQELSE